MDMHGSEVSNGTRCSDRHATTVEPRTGRNRKHETTFYARRLGRSSGHVVSQEVHALTLPPPSSASSASFILSPSGSCEGGGPGDAS